MFLWMTITISYENDPFSLVWKKKEFEINGTVWYKVALSTPRRKFRAGTVRKDKRAQSKRDWAKVDHSKLQRPQNLWGSSLQEGKCISLSPASQLALTCFYQQDEWEWCCTSSKSSPNAAPLTYLEHNTVWKHPGSLFNSLMENSSVIPAATSDCNQTTPQQTS